MIRKFILLVLLAFIITSCQGSVITQSPDVEIVSKATSIAKPSVTANSPTPTKAQVTPTQENKVLTNAPSGCTVISPRPTPGPTEQSIFPPVGDNDWVIGPESAMITIMEYSDFQ